MEDQVLGHHAGAQGAAQVKVHGGRRAQQDLARAEHEGGVGVADTGGELAERPRRAGVRVGAHQDLAGAGVPFFGQGDVAHAGVLRTVLGEHQPLAGIERPRAVGIVNHVVEVANALLFDERAEDVHVAVRAAIGGEDVVIGNDHHLLGIPHAGVFAELAFEHADGAGPADVVGHQHVDVDQDVVARPNLRLARPTGENLFG